VLWLVLAFFTAARALADAAGGVPGDRAGAGLRRRGNGALPVVVMMLDINFDSLRKKFRSYIPVGAIRLRPRARRDGS
jgi:hypothetical protein